MSFADDTSLPHGGETDRALADGDVVLIDTGTQIDGYNSDITRTYVFGEPTADVRAVWNAEKEAQAAAFEAAKLGAPCEAPDYAMRAVLQKHGFGPDYRLPGLPPVPGTASASMCMRLQLCRGDVTLLAAGMCFQMSQWWLCPASLVCATKTIST